VSLLVCDYVCELGALLDEVFPPFFSVAYRTALLLFSSVDDSPQLPIRRFCPSSFFDVAYLPPLWKPRSFLIPARAKNARCLFGRWRLDPGSQS